MIGIGGIVASRMAGVRGLLHGLVVGLAGAALIAGMAEVVFAEGANFGYAYLLFGVPANCFGGWLGAHKTGS